MSEETEQMSRGQLGAALAEALTDNVEVIDDGSIPEEEQPLDALEDTESEVETAEETGEGNDYEYYEDMPKDIGERSDAMGADKAFFYDAVATMDNGEKISFGDAINEVQDYRRTGGGNFAEQEQKILSQQHDMQAHAALEQEYGGPLRQRRDMLRQIEERYKSINWKAQVDEHGDQAEMARMKMQMEYSQLQNEISTGEAEYGTKMKEYGAQVAQVQFQEIVKSHPTWSDGNVMTEDLKELHKKIAPGGLSFDLMASEILGSGGAMKLFYMEMAAKGMEVSSINKNKVKKKIRNIKSGRTITAEQQKRMQAGQRMKQAKSGTRRDRVAASVELLQSSGIV